MRIQTLIFAVLAGCELKSDDTGSENIDTCYGEPMYPSPFSIDEAMDAEQLGDAMTAYGTSDPTSLSCAQLCTYIIENYHFSSVNRVDSCEHSVDVGDTAGEPTGHMACAGQSTYFCEGRRPMGHQEADVGSSLGEFLAHCAHLEAASVGAFAQLAAQLRALGAPAAWTARCLQAADEERDHAQVVGTLARCHGGRVPAMGQAVVESATLEQIALHNAVEGCVAETWAALAAVWKGRYARQPALRAAYIRIAEDELRHAQLAWDLHAWMLGQLDPVARRRVEAAQAAALVALPEQVAAQVVQMPTALGMPAPRQAAAIAASLSQGLLAA